MFSDMAVLKFSLMFLQWWPGGLGKVSTHAVVYARLLTDGQDYGVHGELIIEYSFLS